MAILDLILNLAGLLLYLGWRAVGIDQASQPQALSLASTLRRAERQPSRPWAPLIVLFALLGLRSLVYWQLGPPTGWVPRLDLGVLSLHFRADVWTRMLLFSFLGFAQALVILHLWLLFVALAGRRASAADPLQSLVETLLGPLGRWPGFFTVPLVPLAGGLFWLAASRPLAWLGLISAAPVAVPLWQQGVAFGLGLCLTWTVPAALLLLIHFLNGYLYLGNVGWWHYAARGGQRLVRWLPLAVGKFDLAPLVVLPALLVGAHYASRALVGLFSRPGF